MANKSRIEMVSCDEELLSIIIRSDYEKDGIEFFTPDNFSQQLAYMKRPKKYVIPPHEHNVVIREVKYTQEVLFIKKGRIRVDYYDHAKFFLESKILEAGDVVLLAGGGHGFEILEECEIIEVKQGPYRGEMDKTRFDPVDPGKQVKK